MANRFVEFYNAELTALRERAGRFAEAHPKIAGRLRLSSQVADDPHVERLIESFAYIAARIRQKVDDTLPELSDSLLETLYPHYLAPIPSMTVVSVTPDSTLDGAIRLPRGLELDSEAIDGDHVRFTTTQDVELSPIQISGVKLTGHPFDAPPAPGATTASCLRITLDTMGKNTFSSLGLRRIRLFLSGGAGATQLARLMLQHCTGVAAAAHTYDPLAQRLGPDAVQPAAFAPETALLPYPTGSFYGYRQLTEYAALPEKFMFFDLDLPKLEHDKRVELFVYFDAPADQPLPNDAIRLHATPAINLFAARAEPISLDGTRSEYPLVADARRPQTRIVHSLRHVTATTSDGAVQDAQPFFHRLTDRVRGGLFWQLRRSGGAEEDRSEATAIALVDHRNQRDRRGFTSISAEVLATNGDLPRRLPFGGGQPHLNLASAIDGVGSVTCLKAPTRPRGAMAAEEKKWRLISHLSLNHLSLASSGTASLREILKLYDPQGTPEFARMVEAISDVQTNTGPGRVGDAIVTGTYVRLIFDDTSITPDTAVVFAAAIDRFLGCYTTINSFTCLSVRMANRTDLLAQFRPRAGEEPLI